MKFVIVNSFHRDDKGDASLVHVLVDQLFTISPHAEILISSMEDPREYPMFYKGRNIGSFELQSSSHLHGSPGHFFMKLYIFFMLSLINESRGKFTWLLTRNLKKILREYASADLIVSVGGGYFITKRNFGSRMHLFFALQTLKLCKQLGRKVVTAPVSVGSFQNTFEERATEKILSSLDLVLLREDISERYFVNDEGELPQNIRREPDSGFAFSPSGSFDLKKAIGAKEEELIVVFAVRNWLGKKDQAIYDKAHADLIDHIAAHYPAMRPVFISQCTFPHADDDDRKVGRDIMELSKTKKAILITEDMDYRDVKLAYRQADFVIGTRFHSMVFSLSYNVPGIAIEYEHKTRGIMRDLGLEEWVIPFGAVNSHYLIALFDRLVKERSSYQGHLQDVIPAYRASANNVIGLFSEIIAR